MNFHLIYADYNHYLNFVVMGSEVAKKLGRDYPFHVDRRPKPYAHVWHEPLQITFYYGDYPKGSKIPDVIANNGRIFFNEQAYVACHELIESAGEFLPVVHEEGSGYLFNPLKSTEEVDGVAKIGYDVHDNLESFEFHLDRLLDFSIFRTEVDTYQGIFCWDEFKNRVEDEGFKGLKFCQNCSIPLWSV